MARLCDASVISLLSTLPDCCGLRGTVYYGCHVLCSASIKPRPHLPPIFLHQHHTRVNFSRRFCHRRWKRTAEDNSR